MKLFKLGLLTLILASSQAFSRGISRAPANFITDDDAIYVPAVVKEKSFIEKVQDEHIKELTTSRKTVQKWIMNEEYVQDYGLEGRGIVPVPTAAEKEKFLERNYLRFFSRKVEKNANQGLKNWWEDVTANDEIDAIDNQQKRSEYLVKANRSKVVKTLTKSETINVGKEKFKFIFQPRVEMGSLKIVASGFGYEVRAWVGVNGDQELNVEKRFDTTGTRVLGNYYIDENRLLAAIDQNLIAHTKLRLTHEIDYDFKSGLSDGFGENNTVQVIFSRGF